MFDSVKSQPNHYDTLGLTPSATGNDIAKAFATRIRIDITSPEEVEEHAGKVFMAYETLRDPIRRRIYDASLGLSLGSETRPEKCPEACAEQRVAPFIAAALRERFERPEQDSYPNFILQPEQEEQDAEPQVAQSDASRPVLDGSPIADVSRSKRQYQGVGAGATVLVLGLLTLGMGLTWGDRAPLVPRGPAAATAEQAVPRLAQSSPTALPPAASIDEGAPQLRVATDTSALAPVQLVDTGPLAIGATSAVSSMPAEAPKDGAGETRPAAQSQSGGNGSPADPPAPLPASTTADSADPLAPLPAAAAAGTQPAPTVVAPAAPITPLVNRTAPARLISGALVKEDNPRGRFRGTVTVDFAVQPNGQVTGCRASASSGDRALDLRTCQLVEQRLRFSPALNAQGRPHASQARATYAWGVRHRPLHKRLWELVRR